MNFFVALSCLLAVTAAKPQFGYSYTAPAIAYNHYAPGAYAGYVGHHYAYPYASNLAYAAPVQPYAYAAAPVKSQYHTQDVLGQTSYGHEEPLQSHHQVQDAAGNKAGAYSYVAPSGQVFHTEYVADHFGYRAASNANPVGPAVPADTPEVVAARAAHFAAHAAVKSRARRSAQIHTPYYYAGPHAYHAPYNYYGAYAGYTYPYYY